MGDKKNATLVPGDAEKSGRVFPGADETTPSRSEYFSWINNTNEGATETQTLANLAFFRWLHDHYGVELDIYAFDAGALDGPGNLYGRFDSAKFTRQFPRGFEPCAAAAAEIGCRLGVWGGPDGFGETVEDAQARIDLMARLCKPPLDFALFKFDGVCGPLRPEKAKYFVQMLEKCRKYSPDLIVLNHRLELYEGSPHATTFLLGGMETYVDVSYCNRETCVHHRERALARGLPKLPPAPDHPDGRLTRMTEDHGVCISTFPDAWDDDLVLQAFNRGLILAPEIYGNPWFLRDDEYPKLARLFNLFRRYREILVHGVELPARYGLYPVARGDARRRFLTLRNNSWESLTIPVQLDETIGLGADVRDVVVCRAHPREYWYGTFSRGDTLEVQIPPFHSFLLLVFAGPESSYPEVAVKGCAFDVVREVEGAPVEIALHGLPGTEATVELVPGVRRFTVARLEGAGELEWSGDPTGRQLHVGFPGAELARPWHQNLATLERVPVPADVATLYEAVAFTADNSCLEVRCRRRAGATGVPQVQACREFFFNQPIFRARGCWDRYAFDGDPGTIWHTGEDRYNALRVDFGEPLLVERIRLVAAGPRMAEPLVARASANLETWHPLTTPGSETPPVAQLVPDFPDVEQRYPRNLDERFQGERRVPPPPDPPKIVEFQGPETPIRYFLLERTPADVFEINARVDDKWLPASRRIAWHGTMLFEHKQASDFTACWSATITLTEIPPRGKLCVACEGYHGAEGIYAVLRVGDQLVAAPERAPAYMGRPWEHQIQNSQKNYTYYFPLQDEWIGQPLEVVCLGTDYYEGDCQPHAWLSTWPDPLVSRRLTLE